MNLQFIQQLLFVIDYFRRIRLETHFSQAMKLFVLSWLVVLTGCAGYVKGDLAGIEPQYSLPYCSSEPLDYQLTVFTDAINDYASENLAGSIASYSFGLIPTYANSLETSEAVILFDDQPIYSREDKSRIHKFYGILWVFILKTDTVNALRADEGAGLRVKEGIIARAVQKTVDELPSDIDINQVCVTDYGWFSDYEIPLDSI